MQIDPMSFYIVGTIVIAVLVLIVSAINTILVAFALYNSFPTKQRNIKKNSRREERGIN